MDRDEALKLLKGGPDGIAEWNRLSKAGEEIPVLINADIGEANLSGADLREANLSGANLSKADLSVSNLRAADLREAHLRAADLSGADLSAANLSKAHLGMANLSEANLREAILSVANLGGSNLSAANLSRANLTGANLSEANLSRANLSEAILSRAYVSGTVFADVDLSDLKGLDSLEHLGPSTIGIDTLYRSKGEIPEAFLRGCGVPDYLIENQKALIGSLEPIEFYSCFISYSHQDEEFAKRLHSRMLQEKLRIWFAPEDMPWGRKLHEEIDSAIRVHDKLLLVLSPDSLNSEWVKTEIRKARKLEIKEGKRKLFPIRLVDFKAVEDWECFDPDSKKDLGVEIREYIIPDFSNWKDHDAFEANFARLLKSLKADDSPALRTALLPPTPPETPR